MSSRPPNWSTTAKLPPQLLWLTVTGMSSWLTIFFLGPSYCCHVDLWHVWDYLVFHLFQVRRALPRHGGLNRVNMSQLVICWNDLWFRWIWEWCSWPLCKWSGAWDWQFVPGNPGSFLGQKNSGSVKGLTHDLPSNPPSMILNTPSLWRSISRAHLRSWMNLLGAHKISLSLYLSVHLVQKWWKPSRWKWKKWKGGVGWKSQSWTTFRGGIFLWPAVTSRSKSRRCRWSQGIRRQPPCTSVCVLKIRFLVLEKFGPVVCDGFWTFFFKLILLVWIFEMSLVWSLWNDTSEALVASDKYILWVFWWWISRHSVEKSKIIQKLWKIISLNSSPLFLQDMILESSILCKFHLLNRGSYALIAVHPTSSPLQD